MDINMPEVDGVTATKRLIARGCETPIIALTANVMAEDRSDYEMTGMRGHLAKPIDSRALDAVLARYLPHRTKEPSLSDSPETEEPPKDRVDLEALKRAIGLENERVLRSLYAKFGESLGELIGEIDDALRRDAAEELRQLAHKIKGAAGNLRFHSSYETAKSLEKHLGEGKIGTEGRRLANRLVNLLWHLSDEITSFLKHERK
jgi:HPt (histidine-containing phosphotransfer) domain-containing protein